VAAQLTEEPASGFESLDDAVVLAGGLGTRLAGVVPDRPKALADIAGRPFLAWQLDYLSASGIRRVVLSVGHRGQQIEAAFGNRYGDIAVDYSYETSPLGTGGATRLALQRVSGRGGFVVNGDTLARFDFRALQGHAEERLTIAAVRVDDARRYGTLLTDRDRVVGFAEKRASGPGLVNAGAYWANRDLFDTFDVPKRFSLEEDFLRPSVAEIRPRIVFTTTPMIDIGIPEDLDAAQWLVPQIVASGVPRGNSAERQ